MKNFRNFDCVVNNHNNVKDTPAKPQNKKLTTVAVCCLVFSCPIGYFLATQEHSIDISGVHGFLSLRVINMLVLPCRFCCAFISTGNKITKTVIAVFRTSMVD